jgi:tRNA (adenine57-N1/adenine58-N1)-methyltransferase
MARPDSMIQAQSLILVYIDEKREYIVQAQARLKISTDYGDIKLDDIIGKPYGLAGRTHLGTPFYCLKPSTSEMMMRVKRTTTIVYPKDFGYLLLETAVGPGSQVIEVGTGSGALTLTLAKFVAPDGMVYSYERKEEFLENAKKNVVRAGCGANVEFFCRDAGLDGFLQDDVDAVFIDVPEPWDIVPHAVKALRDGHHLVSLSPNIEQVKRTVDAMLQNGFVKVRVCENQQREILVRERGVRPRERGITHTAYLISGYKAAKPENKKEDA